MNVKFESMIETLTAIAEMKRIYASVEPVLLQSKPVCILITSAMKAEGKTVITAALSILAARKLKKRVLAIDLNCYKPVLHKCFGIGDDNLEQFRRGVSVENVARSTGVNNLDVLTTVQEESGGTGKSFDEGSTASEMIMASRDRYDLIFIDTASVFPANRHMIDPVSVARSVDTTIMVALANVTPRQQVKRALVSLETAGANVLGVVVNQWKNPVAGDMMGNSTQ